MLDEKGVRMMIERVVINNRHLLDMKPATTFSNAPRALMQLSATTRLDVLYDVLEEPRPRYKCDEN